MLDAYLGRKAGLGRKGATAGTPPAQGSHKDLSLLRSWLTVVWWGRGKQALAGRPLIQQLPEEADSGGSYLESYLLRLSRGRGSSVPG